MCGFKCVFGSVDPLLSLHGLQSLHFFSTAILNRPADCGVFVKQSLRLLKRNLNQDKNVSFPVLIIKKQLVTFYITDTDSEQVNKRLSPTNSKDLHITDSLVLAETKLTTTETF